MAALIYAGEQLEILTILSFSIEDSPTYSWSCIRLSEEPLLSQNLYSLGMPTLGGSTVSLLAYPIHHFIMVSANLLLVILELNCRTPYYLPVVICWEHQPFVWTQRPPLSHRFYQPSLLSHFHLSISCESTETLYFP